MNIVIEILTATFLIWFPANQCSISTIADDNVARCSMEVKENMEWKISFWIYRIVLDMIS